MHLKRLHKKAIFWIFAPVLLSLLVRDAFHQSAGSWLAGLLLLIPTAALISGVQAALRFAGARRILRLFWAAIVSLYLAYLVIAFIYWFFLGLDPAYFEKSILNPVLLWVVLGFFTGIYLIGIRGEVQRDDALLTFYSQRKQVSLRTHEICYIESLSDHTLVHRTRGEPLKNTIKISEWEQRIPGFIRIHRAFLINPKHALYRGNSVEIRGDVNLPISRSYREPIKDYFEVQG